MSAGPVTVKGPSTDSSDRPISEPDVVWMFVATIVSAFRVDVFVVA
jgi:hypothetical protein